MQAFDAAEKREECANAPHSKTIRLMEVCGTHTMAIAKAGIKSLLPKDVELISGPGCPVCVTDQSEIDAILALSEEKNVILATYGDMVRVPGSSRGDSLARRTAKGARVEIVYSPLDALSIAEQNPDRQIVFLGVGFETTAPGTASFVKAAKESGLKNVTCLPLLKTCEPVLRALIQDPNFNIDGFLLPGHVSTILGEDGFRFLVDEFRIPCVIGGFEGEDVLRALTHLIRQIRNGEARIENEYRRAVRPEGNPLARRMVSDVFEPADAVWRGIGMIPKSGLSIREEYEAIDAKKRFGLTIRETPEPKGCRCGDVIKGRVRPEECPLFGRVCLPEDPTGPCMVSSEGACAAAYKYREV